MNIDPKHDLLKNSISDYSQGSKNTKTGIGQSMVATAEQKLLDLELKNENEKSDSKKQKTKEELELSKIELEKKLKLKNQQTAQIDKNIERDPLKLLKLF